MNPATKITALLAFLLIPGSLPGQGKQDKKDPEKPKALVKTWPKLEASQKDQVEDLLKLLLSKKEKVRKKAEKQLMGVGLPVGDRLLRRFSDSPHRDVNEALTRILDQILKPEHVLLLAKHQKHRQVAGRRYVISRLARHRLAKLLPTFKRAAKDKDKEVAYYAALGLAATARDQKALDAIYGRCLEEWNEVGDEVTRYLEPIRDVLNLDWIRQKLKAKTVHEQVTALRLMRSLAPKAGAGLVKPYLDSEAALLKKEAINTLRVIVDGQKPLPLKKITVFMIIKMAKEWKARL